MSPALKIALVLSVVGVCGIIAFYAAIAAWAMNTIKDARLRVERSRTEGNIELPPLGPDPWKPRVKLNGGAGRYVIENLGLEIEFPSAPVSEASKYSAEDASRMEATCYYIASNESHDYMFYGVKMKPTEPDSLGYAAEVFEWMFKDDPVYEGLRLRRQNVTWGGKPAIRFSGSFPYYGSQLHVGGIVAVHEGVQFGLLIQEYSRPETERKLRRIVDSTQFKKPSELKSAASANRP